MSSIRRVEKAYKISQISVQNKYDKAPNSGKASLLAACIEKQSGKEKRPLSRAPFLESPETFRAHFG